MKSQPRLERELRNEIKQMEVRYDEMKTFVESKFQLPPPVTIRIPIQIGDASYQIETNGGTYEHPPF